MKKAILSVVAAGLVGLTGCSSDTVKQSDAPAPTPQDSGVKGPPPKDPSVGSVDKGPSTGVGGRTIPGGADKKGK